MDTKNAKQLINEYCQQQKLGNPGYVCTPDQEKTPNGYFCTLTIGAQSFCTSNWQKTKKGAELEGAKLACSKFNLKVGGSPVVMKATNGFVKPAVVNQPSVKPLAVQSDNTDKDSTWITIDKVEDIYQYLTDEVLAQEFKAFLHCKAQEEKADYPVFSASEKDGGYVCICTFNGKQYNSLGVMLTKKQSEQSSAEVCLRTLGDFPAVKTHEYSIQPYKGGRIMGARKETSAIKYMISLLQNVVTNMGLQFPNYRFKEVTEGTDKMYESACWFEGKIFKSATPAETKVKAKQLSAVEALKYLGIEDFEKAQDLKEILRIRKRRFFRPLGSSFPSPLLFCPSRNDHWIFYRYEPLDEYTGKMLVEKDYEGVVELFKRPGGNMVTELLTSVLSTPPSFGGQLLSTRSDLSVAEVDGQHPNVVIIGNNDFAIRLYCENGKIQCANRSCAVDLLPGHNIRGLKCSYQVTQPALQVYLKAESCDDLFYPNPPAPVVTSCGMAILLHDHEASAKDIHILLKRPTSNKSFISQARFLATYLNKQISGASSRFNVAECTANISTWSQNEVNLLSLMTMDSMNELLSNYLRYDDRWNEIFVKELPNALKELKAACIAELERRNKESIVIPKEEDSEPWFLPSGHYRHRLVNTGILLENNAMCTFHGILESTGLKIKLADMETSPTIDLAVTENSNSHRGDFCRYYVWKAVRKVSKGMDEPYYNGDDVVEALGSDWKVDEESEKIKAKKSKAKELAREKRRVLGEAEKGSKEQSLDDDQATIEDDKKMDSVGSAPIFTNMKDIEVVNEEVRWFKLNEAKKVCSVLNQISTRLPFQNQLKALQLEIKNFQKKGV